MSARCNGFFALLLCLATVSLGAEPKVPRPPQMLPKSAHEKSRKLSALDHLRVATQQLEAAGLAEEALKWRKALDKLNRRVIRERAELTRQIAELQKRSEQLRRLTGRPDKILCRCSFLELPTKAAAEFEAAAEPVSSSTGPRFDEFRGRNPIETRITGLRSGLGGDGTRPLLTELARRRMRSCCGIPIIRST